MKIRIACTVLALLILFTGCSLLRLPFDLLNTALQLGKKLIPYSLFAFEIEEDLNQEGILNSRDALAAALSRKLKGKVKWEELSSLESAVEKIRGPRKVVFAIPIPFNKNGEPAVEKLAGHAEKILGARGYAYRPSPQGEGSSGKAKFFLKNEKTVLVNGFHFNEDPARLRGLEKELASRGVQLVFIRALREKKPG